MTVLLMYGLFALMEKNAWKVTPTLVKVNLSLCLTKHHATKPYGEVEIQIQLFLTSALDGGEWSASRPWYPSEKRLGGRHSRSGGDGEQKNIPAPAENRTSVIQPLA
jgi:hypothetical protein